MVKQKSPKMKAKNISKSDIYVSELPKSMYKKVFRPYDKPLFCITIDEKILKTPKGNLVVLEDERAMRELAAEIDYSDELNVKNLSLFNLLCTQIDFVEQDRQEFSETFFREPIWDDPVLRPLAGPEVVEQLKYLKTVKDFLRKHDLRYVNLPQSVPFEGSGSFIDGNEDFEKLVAFVNSSIQKFNPQQLAVFITIAHLFDSPILGLMLANKEINSHEFAVVYLTMFAINSKIWGDTDRKEERELLATYTKQAEVMVRYLDQFSKKLTAVEKIIQAGESKSVEFKSTLRWSIRAKQNDEKIEHEVLKTIVAFLNTDGGTLLVGVEDNGNFLGIELDGFPNEDKYLLYFRDLLVTKIGREYFDIIKFGLEPVKEKKALLVECKRSSKPAFVKYDGKEEFFIRTGPSSAKLSPSEMLEYSKTRFHS
ncbi:MAG: putative DNA binding domain-containing protein [Chloroflexi bacterium]|nr:putative DNA binding domain-containing protein [Chloroflexota bacterium]